MTTYWGLRWAGFVEHALYDFKGNLLATSRRLAADYTDEPDWTPVASSATPSSALAQAASLLETETYSKAFSYDALNRTTSATMPDLSELRPTFNVAGLFGDPRRAVRGIVPMVFHHKGHTYLERDLPPEHL